MESVPMEEARRTLGDLCKAVADGDVDRVVISNRGADVAALVPLTASGPRKPAAFYVQYPHEPQECGRTCWRHNH